LRRGQCRHPPAAWSDGTIRPGHLPAAGEVDIVGAFSILQEAARKVTAGGNEPVKPGDTPEEIAEVVGVLASPHSSWVHGQVIQPNGGPV
jgi:3-oxoacyl-[acyl-carrier protein] reductase